MRFEKCILRIHLKFILSPFRKNAFKNGKPFPKGGFTNILKIE
jgi:hypothetical protein